MMQALAAPVDQAFVGNFAQHAVERRAVGVLGAECARDLARADFAAAFADEGDKLLAGGKAIHRPRTGPWGPVVGRLRGAHALNIGSIT